MTVKTTLELQPGDRVVLTRKGVVRTVAKVTPSDYVNRHNEIIYNVHYREGRDRDWSGGNSGLASTTWELADEEAA